MFNLNNKVILVIGGRGYLGNDFCHHLNKQKATVISADLKTNSQAFKKSNINKIKDNILQLNVNVRNEKSITRVIEKVVNKYGKIDVLIYSVTTKPLDFYSPYTECSLKGWRDVIATELDGLFLVTQKVGKLMEKQKKGNIILLSSIYGIVGNDQRIYKNSNLDSIYLEKKARNKTKDIYSHAAYPTVKGGIISLTKYLAAYWGNKNIRVNCISPGGMEHNSENNDFKKNYSDKVPLGRKGKLNEISPAVVFLSSDESSYLSGHNLIIDGGYTAW